MQEREALVEQLLDHITCDAETDPREVAEAVADRVLAGREAYARVCALDDLLGLKNMLRDV